MRKGPRITSVDVDGRPDQLLEPRIPKQTLQLPHRRCTIFLWDGEGALPVVADPGLGIECQLLDVFYHQLMICVLPHLTVGRVLELDPVTVHVIEDHSITHAFVLGWDLRQRLRPHLEALWFACCEGEHRLFLLLFLLVLLIVGIFLHILKALQGGDGGLLRFRLEQHELHLINAREARAAVRPEVIEEGAARHCQDAARLESE
mmetsp:Transcript_9949/g.21093  ORF Transcript_9949/g.21093 Transcript_9949/m.21093 type:complete len:204 (+) Transcript_9949:79-690(+)